MQGINANNPMKGMLFNLAMQGQISPQALMQVLKFMNSMAQFRQGGPQAGLKPTPNTGQKNAIGQLRGLLGNNFNPFVQNLMRGGPQGIQSMMNQLPGQPSLPGANGLNTAQQQIANPVNNGGNQYNIINNGGTVNIDGGKAPTVQAQGNKPIAPVAPPPPKPAASKIKKGKEWKDGMVDASGKAIPKPPRKGSNAHYDKSGNFKKWTSPLTFDLNGNGKVGTTSLENGKKFDIDGDGKLDQTGWAEKGDGVLAFDADGNGVSGESGKELFGNATAGGGHKNGFEALKALAVEKLGVQAIQDGKLDAKELAQLEKPVAEGGAGLSMMVDGGRMLPSKLGISEIDLGYEEAGANADANGHQHRQVGTGFTRNGQKFGVNDVWYAHRAARGDRNAIPHRCLDHRLRLRRADRPGRNGRPLRQAQRAVQLRRRLPCACTFRRHRHLRRLAARPSLLLRRRHPRAHARNRCRRDPRRA